MNNIERAAEILGLIFPLENGQSWPDIGAEALAAAYPPLLITDEIQAVLDAEVAMTRYLFVDPVDQAILRERLQAAVDAYLASREETP